MKNSKPFTLMVIWIYLLITLGTVHAKELAPQTGIMWSPFLEWSLTNRSNTGNPYDIVASVEFTHVTHLQTHRTEMFFDGGNVWKFRFTGTRMGDWTFKTISDNPQLNGHTGTVTIKPNPDPALRGFLTYQGNKYAIQTGNTPKLEGYLFTAYMQREDFDALKFADWQPEDVEAYCAAAKQNGFEVIFVHVNNNWFALGKPSWKDHAHENPDRNTFEVLEMIITTAHRLGCRVHLWAWGDESRKWTPIGVPGGINGPADRRLQRYIAARLGPLPGWTMGYGFDLHEWVKPDQLNAWADYLHKRMGWQHLLCARGFKLYGEHNIDSYDGFGRNVQIATSSHGPKNIAEIYEDLTSDRSRPHLYEERHSYRRSGFDLDMDGTRRLLWWEAMAGGMGGFFGFYPNSPFPYPHPEQLRTHYRFWHGGKRFRLDMQPANELCTTNGYVLRSEAKRHVVVYQEDASVIGIDLSGMAGALPAVVVDTRKAYAEIYLGILSARKQTITLPHQSDWALAIGTQPETNLVPIAKGWAKSSVNGVVFRRNSVVSGNGEQYVAFYDADQYVVLAKRMLGEQHWEMKKTRYRGNARDAHNSISIILDGEDYLHMSWDHHGHPLRYCRSVAPGSLELTDKLPMTGKKETRVTYPEFYKLPDGNLLFMYRDGASGRGNLIMNYYDTARQRWSQRQDILIDGEGQRNAYWQMAIDSRGTIHLSWVWRETGDVGTNHDIGYARSRDTGITWQKTTGETYKLPITEATAEYACRIPQRSELINQTSMCADAKGQPYIATYWRPHGTKVPQYHVVYHDGQAWRTMQVSQRQSPFSLSGGGTKRISMSRPQIVADTRGMTDRLVMIFRDAERGNRVSATEYLDLSKDSWQVRDLTTFSVGQWEPSYDTELWARSGQLHLFVQKMGQGDGEKTEDIPEQMVSILEWEPVN